MTYLDFVQAVEEDHYFISQIDSSRIRNVNANEGKLALVLESLCPMLIFYPTDKIALMHVIVQGK